VSSNSNNGTHAGIFSSNSNNDFSNSNANNGARIFTDIKLIARVLYTSILLKPLSYLRGEKTKVRPLNVDCASKTRCFRKPDSPLSADK